MLWWERAEPALWWDSSEATDIADPIDPAEANEPTLANEAKEATLPTERTESWEQTESTEFSDQSDHTRVSVALATGLGSRVGPHRPQPSSCSASHLRAAVGEARASQASYTISASSSRLSSPIREARSRTDRWPSKWGVVKYGVVVVRDERLLVDLGGDPEHDHVVVPLAGHGIHRVGPRRAEEDEAAAADLVDLVALRAGLDRHAGHRAGERVEVGDRGPAGTRHAASLLRRPVAR